jgi:oxygen-independent coproporphyrinogen-3 oxidase
MGREVTAFFDSVDHSRAADEYLAVCSLLDDRGYRHYEVSNFARRGFESAHNRVYWGGGEYLGVGPAAHSFIDGRRFQNAPKLEQYLEHTGVDCIARRVYDDTDESGVDLERAMLALRTDEGMPLSWARCGGDAAADLVDSGLARIDSGRLFLTDRGYLVMNDIVLRVRPAPSREIVS